MIVSSSSWVICPRPRQTAKLRLFCFPHAGGGASFFYPWLNTLPEDIELVFIQLPGREERWREDPLTSFPALLQALVPVIRPLLDKPFLLFGHSLGAMISFELARSLWRARLPQPVCLFISGCRAPQIPDPHPLTHTLNDEAFLREIRRFGSIPEELLRDNTRMQRLLHLLRADFTLIGSYRYIHAEPLQCNLSLWGGKQDLVVSYDDLLAWREQTSHSWTIHMVQGGHFFLQSARPALFQEISRVAQI